MRLVKVTAPEGQAAAVAQIAFDAGIQQVSVRQEQSLRANQVREAKDVIDISVSTPKAKAFLDALTAAPFFDPTEYSVSVRQPRPLRRSRPSIIPAASLWDDRR